MDKEVGVALIIKVLLFSFIPTIGVNLIMRPFWGGSVDTNTELATFSTFFTILVLPVYLLIINYYLAKKYQLKQFIVCGLVMVCCVWLSAYFHFINWADSIGSRNSPDGGTEAVISFEQWTGTIIVLIGTIIGHLSLNNKSKSAST